MKNHKSEESIERIEKLTKALQQLEIAKSYVQEVLNEELATKLPEVVPSTPPSLWPGYPHRVGDRVRVLNPNLGQPKQGTIIGRTGEGHKGFIIVQPDNKNKKNILRIPKNLLLL